MDEDKAQRLHDTLAKLKPKGRGGLGLGGGYNFPGSKVHRHGGSDSNGDHASSMTREDGLPNNALYANFVREGSFDLKQHSRNPFGDGRVIKRNFDDCIDLSDGESNSDCGDGGNGLAKRKKAKRKELRKEERKAAKKEAKRRAKLEAKKAAKLEEKRAAKRAEKVRRKQSDGQSGSGGADDKMVKNGTLDIRKQSEEDEGKKTKRGKRRESEEHGEEMGCAGIVSSTDEGEEANLGETEPKKKKKKDRGRKRKGQNRSLDQDSGRDRVPSGSDDIPVMENGDRDKRECGRDRVPSGSDDIPVIENGDRDNKEMGEDGCDKKSAEKGKKSKKKKRKRDADSTTSKQKLMPETKRKKAKKKKKR